MSLKLLINFLISGKCLCVLDNLPLWASTGEIICLICAYKIHSSQKMKAFSVSKFSSLLKMFHSKHYVEFNLLSNVYNYKNPLCMCSKTTVLINVLPSKVKMYIVFTESSVDVSFYWYLCISVDIIWSWCSNIQLLDNTTLKDALKAVLKVDGVQSPKSEDGELLNAGVQFVP